MCVSSFCINKGGCTVEGAEETHQDVAWMEYIN